MCDDEDPEPHGEGFKDGEILALDFSPGKMLQCLSPWGQAGFGPGGLRASLLHCGPREGFAPKYEFS